MYEHSGTPLFATTHNVRIVLVSSAVFHFIHVLNMGSSLSTPISQNDLNASTSSFSRLPSLASYFRSPPQEQFVHTHPEDAGRRLKAVADIEIENLLATKLPRELVHRILDDAEVWGECRVENRRALSVASSGLSPRGRRGFEWGMEQDDELSREMEQGEHEGGGLVDAPGKVWYLVSPPIGCAAEKVKKKEPSVGGEYDYEYAPTAHRNMTRGARQDPGQQLEQQDGPHSSLHDPSEHASGYSSGPSKRGRHWLRSVTVETFSRDQGWSDNQAAYGECVLSLTLHAARIHSCVGQRVVMGWIRSSLAPRVPPNRTPSTILSVPASSQADDGPQAPTTSLTRGWSSASSVTAKRCPSHVAPSSTTSLVRPFLLTSYPSSLLTRPFSRSVPQGAHSIPRHGSPTRPQRSRRGQDRALGTRNVSRESSATCTSTPCSAQSDVVVGMGQPHPPREPDSQIGAVGADVLK